MTILRITAMAAASLAVAALSFTQAQAQMSMTTAGTTAGFSLSTFASGFPATGYCCGPLGVAFTSGGAVLVADYAGTVYRFSNDVDNQTVAANATASTPYSSGDPVGLTRSGSQMYLALQSSGLIVRIDDFGNYQSTLVSGFTSVTGMATNPTNGHIFAGGASGIFDINPVTATATAFSTGYGFYDGLTFSADGSRLYGAIGSSIFVLDTATPEAAPLFSFNVPGGPDGVALGTGGLAGQLYINSNNGSLYQYTLATSTLVEIASGGSRGDFVTVDPNGTLLLTQTDTVLRLTAPSGSGFEPSNVPEPASLAVFGLAVAGLGAMRRRRAG